MGRVQFGKIVGFQVDHLKSSYSSGQAKHHSEITSSQRTVDHRFAFYPCRLGPDQRGTAGSLNDMKFDVQRVQVTISIFLQGTKPKNVFFIWYPFCVVL